ncbi:MAG: FAD-dependent oxidoreductase [Candidatus Thorarchaeota archaeon]|jgi:heterodisulfide reductase subunit A
MVVDSVVDTRIGVFVCHCGLNIAATVDVASVAHHAEELPGVVFSKDMIFTCSSDGLKFIRAAIEDHTLNRVIVASCTPRTHEPVFRETIEDAGLNRYLFEMVNIREHVSWCHMGEHERATEKAKGLIEMAVARARELEPLERESISVIPEVAVIGAGVAGISAALDAANGGYKVHLIERRPTIGGQMALLDKVFPQNDCAICILGPIMASVERHPSINLLTYSEVEGVDGYVGNFRLRVRKKARYVDPEKCNGCAECEPVCLVDVTNPYEFGMAKRKAIYRPFPQAVPNTYTVEKLGHSPCRVTCPVHMNNQGFVALMREGKFEEALEIIREAAPFPRILGRVCHHPCESECPRSDQDEPVALRQLKRFVADHAAKSEGPPEVLVPTRKKKVAIVGAGPSGLTCALELLKMGYQVTVFEASKKPGGLMTSCLPEYRISGDVAKHDIDWVLAHGVDVRYNTRIGKDLTMKELRKEFDSVFLGIGVQNPAKLEVEGSDQKGVLYGLSFLKEARAGKVSTGFGERVIVIGGGNVAIDCARTSIRLGAKKVNLVCLETRDLTSKDRMPAYEWEIIEAEEEGVTMHGSLGPERILDRNGSVSGLETVVCKSVYKADGSFAPEFSVEAGPTIKGDTVIIAIGQRADLEGFEELTTTRAGTIRVHEVSLETSTRGVFAGGDIVSGPASVVEAIASGKEAAKSIDRYLEGIDLFEGRPVEIRAVIDPDVDSARLRLGPRAIMPTLSKRKRRSTFDEVELGFKEIAAVIEAGRCLGCAVCSECKQCIDVCEPKAIDPDMKDEIIDLDVGTIILATGFNPYEPVDTREYGYGLFSNVITNTQLERLTNAAGPTGGKIKRPSDGNTPKSVAFLQCVGSRDMRYDCDYCCYVGCENSLKQATQIKEKYPDTEVTVFAMDVRTHGTGYEELYRRAREMGVVVVKGRASEVEEEFPTGNLQVFAEDLYTGTNLGLTFELVVLATALHPHSDTPDMARKFGINTDQYGYFLCAHPKLRPVESFKDGVFVAGSCLGPMDITKAVAMGEAAAAKAQAIMAPGRFDIEPIYAESDSDTCLVCELCSEVCPYGAPTLVDGQMVVAKELCQGCGTCAAACPKQSISMRHYRTSQIMPMIRAATGKID